MKVVSKYTAAPSNPARFSIAGFRSIDFTVIPTLDRLRLDERQQILVDPILERRAHAVRRALVDLQRRALDHLGRQHGRGADRHDLVVVAVEDQRRDVELLEILGEVRLGKRLDAEVGRPGSRPSCPAARRTRARLPRPWRPAGCSRRTAWLRSFQNCERSASDAGADLVEHLDRHAAGIGRRLQHQRRHGADQHRLGDALRAVAADIAGDFAAAGGVADMDRVLQIERSTERGEIVGVGVHVVAVPGLARAAVAAAVMRDAAVAARGQKEHLVFEGVRAQRPAVAEDDRLSRCPSPCSRSACRLSS